MNLEHLGRLRKYGAEVTEENGAVVISFSQEAMEKFLSPEQLPEETREEWKARQFGQIYGKSAEDVKKLLGQTPEGEALAQKVTEDCKQRWPHLFDSYPPSAGHLVSKPLESEQTYTLQWWYDGHWNTKPSYQNLTWEKWMSMKEGVHKNYDHSGTPWRLITDEVVECNFGVERPSSMNLLTKEAEVQVPDRWFGVPFPELTRKELFGVIHWLRNRQAEIQDEVRRLQAARLK